MRVSEFRVERNEGGSKLVVFAAFGLSARGRRVAHLAQAEFEEGRRRSVGRVGGHL